eukprot:GFYU01000586.1.p1 GENE.GFYU01000586.1~~GFYU01000586.1.p1  ORF type:complete len:465 (+),score=189.99 GFYU01000586.1:78-1472(+)
MPGEPEKKDVEMKSAPEEEKDPDDDPFVIKKRDTVDYSAQTEVCVKEAEDLVKTGQLDQAIEHLLALEKQARLGGDSRSTKTLCLAVVQHCYTKKAFDKLNDNIILISKRRAQHKRAITAVVQECCKYVEEVTDKDVKYKLIETLRTVTAGKFFVELEGARLTMTLAKMKEADGKVTEAAEILQDVAIETYGSMDKVEKAEYILEQMRLCLAKKDYIRVSIVSNKINRKFFKDEKFEQIKLRFFELMIQYHFHEYSYLEIARCYYEMYDTPCVQADIARAEKLLKCVCVYVILSPHNNEQSDFIHRVAEMKALKKIPVFFTFVKHFVTKLIIRWTDLSATFKDALYAEECFKTEHATKQFEHLKNRVIEHNIRVIAQYYSRVQTKRLAQLLDLPEDESERYLSDMVVDKTLFARIDRPAGLVVFAQKKDTNEILNNWSSSLGDLCKLVEKTCHLIHKEKMVHKL